MYMEDLHVSISFLTCLFGTIDTSLTQVIRETQT